MHLGHVTKQGRHSVRALLVEAAWRLITKDPAMEEKYRRVAARAGGGYCWTTFRTRSASSPDIIPHATVI